MEWCLLTVWHFDVLIPSWCQVTAAQEVVNAHCGGYVAVFASPGVAATLWHQAWTTLPGRQQDEG
eukprot:1299220-Amphidinium_carterae.1